MSTHTTYFCDACNSDHDTSHPEDDGHAISYDGMPTYNGWAEFGKPYIGYSGREMTAEYHVCAHCLADPDFDPSRYGKVSEWDKESQENIEKGRAHGERYAWAYENLGTADRWGRRGVRQVFGDHGHQVGPKLKDGGFTVVKHDWEIEMDARRAEREAARAA